MHTKRKVWSAVEENVGGSVKEGGREGGRNPPKDILMQDIYI